MEAQMQDSLIFALHIGLLAVKLVAVAVIAQQFIIRKSLIDGDFMFIGKSWRLLFFIFTLTVLSGEAWILSNYYLVDYDFYYESLAIMDQLVLTIAVIISYKGGKSDET